MKLREVFTTIQGEGLFAGSVTTFIRFAGCSLHCSYCDTAYSWRTDDLHDVGVPHIIDEVLKVDPKPRHICITGGEPLEQPQSEIFSLFAALHAWTGVRGLQSIVLETNGAQDVRWILDKPFRWVVHLSVDFKLPSSGNHKKMLMTNYQCLGPMDVVKFICEDDFDLRYARNIMKELAKFDHCRPVMLFHSKGGLPEDWLAQSILGWTEERERWDLRTGVQLHKLLKVR